ncbi:type VI secretion system baseplate subunit TssF [Desulfatitalea alkaliphila]|uniref:Type VI secretion system baseplate subunit TssF n=1 Tax=Desulfatitalea alkaliphila TaxID=2929485 RepID=A0AA41R3R9_9BACT|nr:type VI secretion system baseplate subunit TssF [Desulfatitalea alkaliphila]MCJ8501789.1 type VI secretion system baseplate subunit TssF [Desulfatitalea alkaliphila]
MFDHYFHQELAQLRDLGAEFAKAHPAVAPMLSGMSTDPDAERLLEGVAFLTALLRQRLDDDFPEIVQELFQLIWPHYLRPLPAATIVAFTPKANPKQAIPVAKGTYLASEPVEGTACTFRTCSDVVVEPLTVEQAAYEEQPGRPPRIRLQMALKGVSLKDWRPERLRFHLAGSFPEAADIYLLLRRHLQRVVLTAPEDNHVCVLPAEDLRPVGFDDADVLIEYPPHSFPGYRILQEYFLLPEKFLFLDLHGWQQWTPNGDDTRFEIRFELTPSKLPPPRVRREHFALAATPAINIFPYDADPIRLDHRKSEYRVMPSGGERGHFQIHSVTGVTGFVQGTAKERVYAPFELFSPNPEANPTYHLRMRQSPVRHAADFYLSVAYPPGAPPPATETLSIQLQCTNGQLPEGLQRGDIRHPTSNTPEFVAFTNLRPPTASVLVTPGSNLHWKLLSHLCLNYQSLTDVDNFRALLGLYNFEENRDRPAFMAHQKRISGVRAIRAEASDRLVDRVVMRGREIRMEVHQDHFSGPGDLFLFGTVLSRFFGLYASINTYTRLSMQEILKGESYQWKARIGDHPLI